VINGESSFFFIIGNDIGYIISVECLC